MRANGRSWHSAPTAERGLRDARMMYGPGYRVTFVRSKPDPLFPGGLLVLVRWEVVDQNAVDAEYERRFAPMTGLQVQALSYLSESS